MGDDYDYGGANPCSLRLFPAGAEVAGSLGGFIFRDHGFEDGFEAFDFVFLRALQQGVEVGQQFVVCIVTMMIAQDHDFFVFRGHDIFICGNQFFIELFAGAESCVYDENIHIRFLAGQSDQVARHIGNLYGGTHFQHKNFAAFAKRACLQDELACLRGVMK